MHLRAAPLQRRRHHRPSRRRGRLPPNRRPPRAQPLPRFSRSVPPTLGPSWRPGCPLDPQRLRRVEINYIGFDGADAPRRADRDTKTSRARGVRDLRASCLSGCAIRSRRSAHSTATQAPTTSCRWKTTTRRRSTAERSPAPADGLNTHTVEPSTSTRCSTPTSIGRGAFQPKTAAPYVDRNRTDPGVLHAGDPAVRVFTDRGWRWGGDWRTPKDYQHFER